MAYEYSTGVRMIDDEVQYRPRKIPFKFHLVLRLGFEARYSRVQDVRFSSP
jgi:hypothetical protein